MSRSVTVWSRGAPILGASCAFPYSLPPSNGLFCSVGQARAKKYLVFVPVFDGRCSRGPASDPLRRAGGPAGFQGASRPPHHLTRIPRSPTPAHPHLMHDPHQERDGRERLLVETLGVGSLAFCDMPLLVEYRGPDKPLVPLPRTCLLWRIHFLNAIVSAFVAVWCRVNSVRAVARSPRDALARSEYPNRQDRDRMFLHNASPAIPFTVRDPFQWRAYASNRLDSDTDTGSCLRCSNRNYRQQWDVLNGAKTRILEMVYAQHTPAGVRIAAIKFMQRVILVQTRGVTDPRVRTAWLRPTGFTKPFHLDLTLMRSDFHFSHSSKTRTTQICPCAHLTTHSSQSRR